MLKTTTMTYLDMLEQVEANNKEITALTNRRNILYQQAISLESQAEKLEADVSNYILTANQ
jgi:cell division protein FtsB